ncbi:MAG: preprotein translocase subunit YajC [Actinobacteria bacterium]|nr:MAG: preprotein translocase subunit YajC [Actinomycetota bacterium]
MNGQYTSLLYIVVIIGVFYFLLIRPQQQRTKQQREMLSELEPGAEILTIGGVFATVVSVGDRIRVRLVDGAEMEIVKNAVAQVVPASDAQDDDAPANVESSEPAEDAESDVAE